MSKAKPTTTVLYARPFTLDLVEDVFRGPLGAALVSPREKQLLYPLFVGKGQCARAAVIREMFGGTTARPAASFSQLKHALSVKIRLCGALLVRDGDTLRLVAVNDD